MKRDTASGVIKLTAILVIFSGLVLISVVFLQIQNMNSMFQEMAGQAETFGEMERTMMASSGIGQTGYITPVVIMIWGAILYALNRPLSLLVAKD
ncbi:hypothetical protein [Rhodohalobacter mucosus]|uniref:Uncharacterized protein n=1 Tax=Rhodohalobacter mucosus TaxID=2079485 RepID=A0A316TPQ3_9BACT|nr:hypothetical protein [Rhodohalobacter mucosus]PWN06603.1 hypothetical protein DDZ15_08785 [Rhodohalobacter mucosus]